MAALRDRMRQQGACPARGGTRETHLQAHSDNARRLTPACTTLELFCRRVPLSVGLMHASATCDISE